MLAQIDAYYRPANTLAGTVLYIPRADVDISPIPDPRQLSDGSGQPIAVGEPVPLGDASFIAEPYIALNPTNPEHLAAIATRTSKQNCEMPNCKIELVFFASEDGGATWRSPATFNYPQQALYSGQVAFGPSGILYILALRNDAVALNQTTAEADYIPSRVDFEDASRARVYARPWLQLHPETGEMFLTFDAQESDMLYVTPSLKRSDDGVRWSVTARANQHISASDIFS
ncbi:MAG: hypothetical protein GY803_24800, partial [Chloroflexi bacterium]|nr:hypothetical protein [Chloroflexota bacterium]